MNKKTLSLVQGAMIAALYAMLFYAQNALLPGSATLAVQFRIAELLCIFALWTPAAIWGLALGCIIANIASIGSGLPLDMIFGTIATILAATCIWLLRNVRIKDVPVLSLLMPAVFNGIIIGWEIEAFFIDGPFHFVSFLTQAGLVALGEFVVVLVCGAPLAMLIEKKGFLEKMKLK